MPTTQYIHQLLNSHPLIEGLEGYYTMTDEAQVENISQIAANVDKISELWILDLEQKITRNHISFKEKISQKLKDFPHISGSLLQQEIIDLFKKTNILLRQLPKATLPKYVEDFTHHFIQIESAFVLYTQKKYLSTEESAKALSLISCEA